MKYITLYDIQLLANYIHESLQINQNGLISFQTEFPTFVNIQFPLEYPAIAPLYSDVDTRIVGSIYYRWVLEQNNFTFL